MEEDLKNVLICRTDHLGDVLLAQPVAAEVRRIWPGARVCFLADPSTAEVPRHNPAVDEVMDRVPRTLGEVFRWSAMLRRKRFDAAILVYPDWRVALGCVLAGIPLRVGTGFRAWSLLFNRRVHFHRSRGEKRHEAEYNLNLLQGLKPDYAVEQGVVPVYEVEDGEALAALRWLDRHGLAGKRFIVVHPGSSGSALNWDAARYAEVGEALSTRFQATIVLTGTEREKGLVEDVKRRMRAPSFSAAGMTDLVLLAGILRRCALFLGSSTGPLHLAAAVGAPCIGIYCPISVMGPWRWGPLGPRAKAVLSLSSMECPKCTGKRCVYHNCMDLIRTEHIVRAAEEVMREE